MAKIKFGNVEVKPTNSVPNNDTMEMVQKFINMLPKPQTIEVPAIDLSAVKAIDDRISELSPKVDAITQQLNIMKAQLKNNKDIIIPEIKSITYTKDVSEQVLQECTEMLNNSESLNESKLIDLTEKLDKKLRNQIIINVCLIVSIILITLLHLF